MDTDAPPGARGVSVEAAILTLTAPELIAAFLAARDTPIPEPARKTRAGALMSRELAAEAAGESERGPRWNDHAQTGGEDDWPYGDNGPGSEIFEARRRKRIADQAEAQLREEQLHEPRNALNADFQQRVRDGRIIASWIDLNRPADGARDYPGEVAALIVWQNGQPTLGQTGTVLTDLRYRGAGRVLPRSGMRLANDQARGLLEAPDLQVASGMPAVPPSEGWTIMEAAAALLPRAMAAVMQGGEAHEKWVEASGRNSAFRTPLPPPGEGPEARARARRSEGFFWISCDLVDAVRARPELTFSGLDPSRPIDAPRVVLPREVLGLAGYDSSAPYRIDLEVTAGWDRGLGEAALVISPRASTDEAPPPETRLVAVRVQLSQFPIQTTASLVPPAEGNRRGAKPGKHPANGDIQRLPAIAEVMRLVEAGAHRSIRAALLALVEIPARRNPGDVIRPYQEQIRREHPEWYAANVRRGDD